MKFPKYHNYLVLETGLYNSKALQRSTKSTSGCGAAYQARTPKFRNMAGHLQAQRFDLCDYQIRSGVTSPHKWLGYVAQLVRTDVRPIEFPDWVVPWQAGNLCPAYLPARKQNALANVESHISVRRSRLYCQETATRVLRNFINQARQLSQRICSIAVIIVRTTNGAAFVCVAASTQLAWECLKEKTTITSTREVWICELFNGTCSTN